MHVGVMAFSCCAAKDTDIDEAKTLSHCCVATSEDTLLPAEAGANLNSAEWTMRKDAAETLGRFGEAAEPFVLELAEVALHDEHLSVRASAAQALRKLGNVALPAWLLFAEALFDKKRSVR